MTRRWAVPRPQPDTLWVPAPLYVLVAGTPAVGTVGAAGTAKLPCWLIDGVASESVSASVRLPAHWLTYNADLWWANVTAGAGNVVWRTDRGVTADASAPPAVTSNQVAAVAAPAQNVVKVTADALGAAAVAAPTAAQTLSIGITRLPVDANDTLAADVGFVGLLLRRVA